MQRNLCVFVAITSMFYESSTHGAFASQVAPAPPVAAPQQPSPSTAEPMGQQPSTPGYPPPASPTPSPSSAYQPPPPNYPPSAYSPQPYPTPSSPPSAYQPPPPAPSVDYIVTTQPYPHQMPRRSKRRGLGLMITGWSVFGATYLLTAAVGTSLLDHDCRNSPNIRNCQRFGAYLLIPVAGPLVSMAETSSATGRFALVLPFVAQSAGVAMIIAGTVLFARSKRANQIVSADGVRLAKGWSINAGPTTALGGGQVQLNYRF